ncbi:MAG: hypothetical protein GYB31_08055 [Bacteroidetes bacterium]|nr:hypothetical protein [Bacteroidota bacterium]
MMTFQAKHSVEQLKSQTTQIVAALKSDSTFRRKALENPIEALRRRGVYVDTPRLLALESKLYKKGMA